MEHRQRIGGNDQRGGFARGRNQVRLWRQSALAVQNDPARGARAWGAGRQHRVVRQSGADAHDNSVHAAAQLVDQPAGSLAADPFRISRARGDFAVQRHGPLGVDVGFARGQQFQVGRIELPRIGLTNPRVHGDAGSAQARGPLAGHLGKRVFHGRHHPADARLDDGLGAGRRFALMAARFQRDIKRAATGRLTRLVESVDFRVRFAKALVPAFAGHGLPADDDRSHQRVGFHVTAAALGQEQGPLHHFFIVGHDVNL